MTFVIGDSNLDDHRIPILSHRTMNMDTRALGHTEYGYTLQEFVVMSQSAQTASSERSTKATVNSLLTDPSSPNSERTQTTEAVSEVYKYTQCALPVASIDKFFYV